MPKVADFYERLGISGDASKEEIRKAYLKAAHQLHPDVNVEPGATELFLDLKEAYEILIDPSRRTAYDGKSKTIPPPPVRLSTHYSRETLPWMTEEQLVYTLLSINILADQIKEEETSPPTNISLVLDCSTSMKGSRLEMVRATAIELVRQLRSQDILSLVIFNDRPEIIIPSSSDPNNVKNISRIRNLQTRGGTEIFQGLRAGYKELLKNLSPYYINHIVLITDGHTYGDEQKCHDLAKKSAGKNIGISCLGIGNKWNDAFLEGLAKITGGSCFYINDPRDIQILLKQKFKDLGRVHIEGIKLNFQTGSGVKLNYAFRLEPEANALPISSPVSLGNIPRGSNLSIILEFLLSPVSPSIQKVLLAEGSLTFNLPKHKDTSYRIPLNFLRVTSANPHNKPPQKIIIDAMSKLTLYRMQEQANKELEAGKYDKASSRLKNMATHLFSQGESDLAKTVIKEAESIKTKKGISEEGQKKIKYGTQALFLPRDLRKK